MPPAVNVRNDDHTYYGTSNIEIQGDIEVEFQGNERDITDRESETDVSRLPAASMSGPTIKRPPYQRSVCQEPVSQGSAMNRPVCQGQVLQGPDCQGPVVIGLTWRI
ncbi:Na(+)-translocating NADH-quinone reductase subunit A [Dissostichus eleginoides]|uniref:Na(+)-translocating NADH-quinone reductase subunit A n=1 Tax=Dissostichus eleginoides TaxID=100907 RepID=A0AAD9C844_DISEL|nr:Na(+)-translocating NADH-quinone reductase subunit A [Dissostichus eleginoides]